jgi:hypothetical protein
MLTSKITGSFQNYWLPVLQNVPKLRNGYFPKVHSQVLFRKSEQTQCYKRRTGLGSQSTSQWPIWLTIKLKYSTFGINNSRKQYFYNTSYEAIQRNKLNTEVSGSHGGEYEDDCLLSCCAVYSSRSLPTFHRPDDGSSKHLWNVGKLLPDYTALQPRRQPS